MHGAGQPFWITCKIGNEFVQGWVSSQSHVDEQSPGSQGPKKDVFERLAVQRIDHRNSIPPPPIGAVLGAVGYRRLRGPFFIFLLQIPEQDAPPGIVFVCFRSECLTCAA